MSKQLSGAKPTDVEEGLDAAPPIYWTMKSASARDVDSGQYLRGLSHQDGLMHSWGNLTAI